MNNLQIATPLFTITLPLVMAIFIAAWLHNKHFDALNARIAGVDASLSRRIDDLAASLNRRIDNLDKRTEGIEAVLRDIQTTLRDLDRRVTRIEERSSPIVRS